MAKKKDAKPRTKVRDLPKPEQELTPEEQKNVRGGISGFGFGTSAAKPVSPSGDTSGDTLAKHVS